MESIRRCPSVNERICDIYLIIMLLIFPLFPGFSGYAQITLSKFLFLLCTTALWALSLLIAAVIRRTALPRPAPAGLAALVWLAVSALSCALSPNRGAALLGAGRFDGLLTTFIYVLIFLGLSAYARPKLLHAKALAVSVTICAAVALLQLAGYDVLRLFPAGVGYYDSGLRYTGAFLGTIGNTNILDAVFCTALPLFAGLYICGFGAGFLVPCFSGVVIICRAGGDGCKLALLVCLLAALPLLLTELPRIRRALRVCALCLAAAALSSSVISEYNGAALSLRFSASVAALCLCAAAAAAAGLSFFPMPQGFAPSAKRLRRSFLTLDILAVFAGLVVIRFLPGTSGTLYELHCMLCGQFDESFGSSRIRIWRACLALIPEHPLLGGGPGTLALRLDVLFTRFVPETGVTLRTFADNAHNLYLACLANTGIAGLAALLFCYVLSAVSALKSGKPLIFAFALGALGCAVHDIFGLALCISEPLLWICLALLCAEYDNTLEEKP